MRCLLLVAKTLVQEVNQHFSLTIDMPFIDRYVCL